LALRSPLTQNTRSHSHFGLAITSNSKPIPDLTLILALRSPLIQNLYPDLTLILALRSPLSKPQIITSLQVKNSLDSQTSLLNIMDEISKNALVSAVLSANSVQRQVFNIIFAKTMNTFKSLEF
jgi:hypothetical protein